MREHYIPCFYSKVFARPAMRNGRTWCWRKGQVGPHGTSPEEWGVENDFYGVENDKIVTQAEDEVKEVLEAIRTDECISGVLERLPNMVAHLIRRTAATRSRIREIGVRVVEGAKAALKERGPEAERAQMIHRLKNRDRTLRELFQEELRHRGIRGRELRGRTEERFEECIRALKAGDGDIGKIIEDGELQLLQGFTRFTKAMHTSEVVGPREEEKWLERYTYEMGYALHKVRGGTLFLPDHLAVQARRGEDQGSSPLEGRPSEMESIYMPIGPDLLLVGRKTWAEERSVEWIYEELAKTSDKSFIHPDKAADLGRQQKLIGVGKREIRASEGREMWNSSGGGARDRKKR